MMVVDSIISRLVSSISTSPVEEKVNTPPSSLAEALSTLYTCDAGPMHQAETKACL